MESETLKNFITETETCIPMIRNGILVCSQEGNLSGELETALLYSQAIRDAASAIGLKDIGNAGDKLHGEIRNCLGKTDRLSDLETRRLLDELARLEAFLAKLQFGGEDFSANLEGFVDRSFVSLGFDHPAEEVIVDDEPEHAGFDLEGFEIDEEMLQIFAEEAEQLISSMNEQLGVLKIEPNNRESLLEIRRNAHTLKGSAGIVGIKPLSDLAHRVEDLLDYLAEKEIDSNERIFSLLLASTDCLGALSSGDTSTQLTKRISGVYASFEQTLEALHNGTFHAKEEVIEVPFSFKTIAAPENPVQEAQSAPSAPKAVVRVSLEKLDELVRLVGDLVISRSVFEQRLAEFERQVNEMQHTTGRLLRSTGKLETDFEASMLEGTGGGRFQYPGQMGSMMIPQTATSKFDSLELDRYTDFHQTTRELLETAQDNLSIHTELDNLRGNLELLFSNQSHLIEEMHDKLLRLRMVKFGSLSSRLQRTVRVTCEQEGKQAELFIDGEETEVDTQILDLLVEPLLHLLRNAVAHGIESPDTRRLLGKAETGKIYLKLHSEGTHVIMSVTDDGRGISAVALREKAVRNGFISQAEAEKMSDEDAFSLGFLPGITTAESISQTSGRGVGMNIVKTSVARGQGTIAIASEPQKGATFTIRMPMALAITRGLLVRISGRTFAFPVKLVKQVTEISAEEYSQMPDQSVLQIGGANYAINSLGSLLKLPHHESKKDYLPLILLETLDTPCALTVDEIIRAEEIVIKPLTAPLSNYPNLLGATILGDGNVVPVLDLIYILKNKAAAAKLEAGRIAEENAAEAAAEPEEEEALVPEPELLKVMIVDDSPSVRHITSKLVKNAGWDVVLAKDGVEALEALQSADRPPNVILTDVEMPRMDGYELLSSVRRHETLNHLPVIMITSRASQKHQQKAIELGVSEYLTKPFDDATLIATIKTLSNAV